jgi:hypothetical protein
MPKSFTEKTLIGDILHHWTIQEYDQHQRGVFWYIITITVGLLLVIYGLFSSNFLFSLIIILAAIILFLQSHQEAPQVQFGITELGVLMGSKFYTYSELEDFYIIYEPPEIKTLYIDTKSGMRPMLRIPLLDENPLEVRTALRNFLAEDVEKEEEPLADAAARRWKIH